MEVYTRYRVVSMLLLMLMSVGLSDGAEFHCPEAILAFGDSLTDTGELVQAFIGEEGFDASARPPYGITYFGRPVDRDSDGRLIIDFLCKLPSHQLPVKVSRQCMQAAILKLYNSKFSILELTRFANSEWSREKECRNIDRSLWYLLLEVHSSINYNGTSNENIVIVVRLKV